MGLAASGALRLQPEIDFWRALTGVWWLQKFGQTKAALSKPNSLSSHVHCWTSGPIVWRSEMVLSEARVDELAGAMARYHGHAERLRRDAAGPSGCVFA